MFIPCPYNVHFRNKVILYLVTIILGLYFWFNVIGSNFQVSSHLRPYHPAYVNFKHLLIASVLAAKKGGIEVKHARNSRLKIDVKGKTREGVVDVLTSGDKKSNAMMVNSLLHTFPGIKVISEENLPNTNIIDLLPVERHLKDEEYSTIPENIHLNIDDIVIWIDPLDATKEYSEGLTEYVTTMVCIARNGEPIIGVIHQPFQSRTFWASKFGIDKKLLKYKFQRNEMKESSSQVKYGQNPLRIIISRSHKGDVRNWLLNNSNLAVGNIEIIEAAGSGYKTLQLVEAKADIYLHKTYIKKWDICAPNVILKYGTEDGTLTNLNGESIDYSFQTDVINRNGVFAIAHSKLKNVINDFNSNHS